MPASDRILRVGLVGASVGKGWNARTGAPFVRDANGNAIRSWGPRAHVPAIKSMPADFELTAICTSREETAAASAEAFGARLAFSDYHRLLDSPEVDIVAITVSVRKHKEIALAAIGAGKHVYCEWPLGVDEQEAREMAAAARDKPVQTIVGLQGRSAPWCERVRELRDDGYFGRIHHINAKFFGLNPRLAIDDDLSVAAKRNYGQHIFTIRGIHLADMVCSLFGEFTRISARVGVQVGQWPGRNGGPPVDVDAPDYFAVHADLPEGGFASLHFAYVPGFTSGWNLEVYGEKATLTAKSPESGHFEENDVRIGRVGDTAGMRPLDVPARLFAVPPDTTRREALNVAHNYALLARAIRTGRPSGLDFEAALDRYRMMRAMERSSALGGTSVAVEK